MVVAGSFGKQKLQIKTRGRDQTPGPSRPNIYTTDKRPLTWECDTILRRLELHQQEELKGKHQFEGIMRKHLNMDVNIDLDDITNNHIS